MVHNAIFYFRKDYQAYLKRPDHKQEFLGAWHKVRELVLCLFVSGFV